MLKSKKYWLIVGIIFISVFTIIFVYAQDGSNLVYESDFTKIGLQYKFDNGWSYQFEGKLHPINDNTFTIEWFRYEDETSIRNTTFHNQYAYSYAVDINFYITNDTQKTRGIFYVEWINENGKVFDYDIDEGELVIRDYLGLKRPSSDILKVRKYYYEVGDYVEN